MDVVGLSFEFFLEVGGEGALDAAGDLLAELPVPITDPKVVQCWLIQQVWRQNEAVLVDLVGIVGDVAHPRREGKLRHHILYFPKCLLDVGEGELGVVLGLYLEELLGGGVVREGLPGVLLRRLLVPRRLMLLLLGVGRPFWGEILFDGAWIHQEVVHLPGRRH